jgi:dihydrofolate synthase/folylpolyglutamate synthase
MPPGKLADLASGVFGPDRVHTASRLDIAIDIAVGLADDSIAAAGGPAPESTVGLGSGWAAGGTAVLITGSVITAGDALLLLSGGSDGGRPAGSRGGGGPAGGADA